MCSQHVGGASSLPTPDHRGRRSVHSRSSLRVWQGVGMAGYSPTPLAGKLGIKAGHHVLLDGAPPDLDLGELPAGVVVHRRAVRVGPAVPSDRLFLR